MKTLENILNLENDLINLLSEKNQELVAIATTIKGNSISYIKNYFSKSSGNVNNYFVRLGYSNENAIQHDFEIISNENAQKIVLDALSSEYSIEAILKPFNELKTSLEIRTSSDEFKAELLAQNNATMNRSKGQTDAFTTLAKGVSIHNETKQIYIFGLAENKVFVEKRVEVKQTKSKENTIIKRKIEKILNFRQAKIRRFIFNDTQISLQGLKIQA